MRIRRKIALGHEEEKILEVAHEENIDLVVLAFRKRPFFRNLMARTRCLKMISRLPCPVLLKSALAMVDVIF